MKRYYKAPEIEIIKLDIHDILCSSGGSCPPYCEDDGCKIYVTCMQDGTGTTPTGGGG